MSRAVSMRSLAVLGGALFILVLAAVPRIACLGCQSLWLDEVLTAEAVRQPTIGGALDLAASWVDQAPLQYVMTWALRGLGPAEFAIRLPYAIAGVLAAVAMYALATSLFGRLAGLLGGVLMAVLPYAVYYSQESRSYILLILLTTLLMLVAIRVARRHQLLDWGFLVVVGSLSLYVGYLAVATLAAAYSYIVVVVLVDAVRAHRSGDASAFRSSGPPLAGVLIAAVVTAVTYLPWAPTFLAFLGRRDLGFGRVTGAAGQAPTPDAILAVLRQLDLHGLSLVLLVVGVMTALVFLTTYRWRAGLLPLFFLFLPLAGFLVLAGGGIVQIWTRYFSILYPPIVLLVALGIVGLADAAALTWRRLHGATGTGRGAAIARSLVAVGLVMVLGVSAATAVEAAQRTPKGSDYRGAVDLMMAVDPVRPVVLATGPNAAWVERGLVYYAWARGSDLRVIDGLAMDLHSLDDLRASTSLWLSTREMDPSKVAIPDDATRSDHADFALFEIGSQDGEGVSSARDLLGSLAGAEPALVRSARMIDALEGDGPPGDELLPAPTDSAAISGAATAEQWALQPGVAVAHDGSGFVASPAHGEVNATIVTERLAPGADYLLQFGCRTTDLRGALRAWVIATDAAGDKVYLDGSGERCRTDPGTGESVIAFTVPDGAHLVTIQLQATGSGRADIGPISLHELR